MRPVNELINKKREAVRLRLGGLSLAQVKAKTGLSVPTIVKSMDAFKATGWKGLESKSRGRKPSVKVNAQQDAEAILQALLTCSQRQPLFCSLEEMLAVYAKTYKAISKKTLLRRLERLIPERDHRDVFARMDKFAAGSDSGLTAAQVALLSRSRRFVLGFQPLADGCVFYTQDRRGERRFVYYVPPAEQAAHGALSERSLIEQLARLVLEASPEKPFFVVIKTDSLARYQHLAAWQKANEDRCFLFAQWGLPE